MEKLGFYFDVFCAMMAYCFQENFQEIPEQFCVGFLVYLKQHF